MFNAKCVGRTGAKFPMVEFRSRSIVLNTLSNGIVDYDNRVICET